MEQEKFSYKLRKWFFLNRRTLPWRENPSPYEVWVSEVMLQQTQVSVVIPYFQRWMEIFPTISALSRSPVEKVIKAWEGLGYYSRARNLHQGAQYLTKEYEGELPASYDELKKVKGLGSYTIGAILSFAFKQKAPAVDGNVLRVMARYYLIEESIDKAKIRKQIEKLTHNLLPDKEPWIVMEALIELGALVCQKKPQCFLCPLKEGCRACRECKADLLPNKKRRAKIIHLHRVVAVVHTGAKVLVRKGGEGKVMANLWEFPYFDQGVDIEKALDFPLKLEQKLSQVTHSFTRYKAFLYPKLFYAKQKKIKSFHWISYNELNLLPFSSGHRRILQELNQQVR